MDLEKKASVVSNLTAVEDTTSLHGNEVKRDLKPRQIIMIAMGGAIGTGFFIGTGSTLAHAGPAGGLICFLFMTTLCHSVTQSLGEMTTYIPITGSFSQFITRWCSPALGAAVGWNYWFSWAMTYALELSVVGQIIQLWTDKVPLAAWISIFFVFFLTINLFPVKFYGEIEFWVTFLKVLAMVGWLFYALCIVCGAGPYKTPGFSYWKDPGPWGPGLYSSNISTGRFLGWVQTLLTTAFTFQGTETVGIAAGESKNPRKSIPSAINKLLLRMITFYVLSMFFVGMLVPWNDPRLGPNLTADSPAGSYTSTSPFIIAMFNSGTKVLPDIFNALILATIMSAGISNIYYGSRILYGLAQAKVAPPIFLKSTPAGVPWIAVCFTAAFGLLGFLALSEGSNTAFNWLLNISGTAGLIAWAMISFVHIRFMNILSSRGISRDSLPFKASFMPYSAHYAFVAFVVITFLQGIGVFFQWDVSTFFVNYVSLMLFVVSWIGFHFYFNGKESFSLRSLLIPIEECDIDTGVREIDEMVWEDDTPRNLWERFWEIVA